MGMYKILGVCITWFVRAPWTTELQQFASHCDWHGEEPLITSEIIGLKGRCYMCTGQRIVAVVLLRIHVSIEPTGQEVHTELERERDSGSLHLQAALVQAPTLGRKRELVRRIRRDAVGITMLVYSVPPCCPVLFGSE